MWDSHLCKVERGWRSRQRAAPAPRPSRPGPSDLRRSASRSICQSSLVVELLQVLPAQRIIRQLAQDCRTMPGCPPWKPRLPIKAVHPSEVFLTGTARTRQCFGESDPAQDRNRGPGLYYLNGQRARWPCPEAAARYGATAAGAAQLEVFLIGTARTRLAVLQYPDHIRTWISYSVQI